MYVSLVVLTSTGWPAATADLDGECIALRCHDCVIAVFTIAGVAPLHPGFPATVLVLALNLDRFSDPWHGYSPLVGSGTTLLLKAVVKALGGGERVIGFSEHA